MADEKEAKKVQNNDTLLRLPDLLERYANNVKFESSDWDLKLTFGLLDQTTSPLTVRQHTTMNVPWTQAKIMAFYVAANVLIHEHTHGPIKLTTPLLPPKASDMEIEMFKTPEGKKLAEQLDELRSNLL